LAVTASVFLGAIPPEDVRVQIVSGSLDQGGTIVKGASTDMTYVSRIGDQHQYQGQLECLESGSYGFSVRVIPYHPDVRIPFEHPWLVWAQ
jgi:starch phosphorylase